MENNRFDTTIETNRLLLRPLRISDAPDMLEYTSNPEVTKHLSWHAHTDIKQTKSFLKVVLDKYKTDKTEFTYGIELKEEKKLIGVLKIFGISLPNKRAEFSSILNPTFQKKGYMGEAWQGLLKFCFEEAGLNRIQSHVTLDNIASQRKNDKAGLKYEGTLRHWWFQKGRFYDAMVYSITASDYFLMHEKKNES